MDLYDFGAYFSRCVPVAAVANPLLCNAACAYAAKHLNQVQGRRCIMGGAASSYRAEMESPANPEPTDWAYVGAQYYDKAIKLLMEELAKPTRRSLPATPMTPMMDETPSPASSGITSRSVPAQTRPRPRARRARVSRGDDTIAAAAILSVYEFMDHENTAWARHLNGTKSLFDLADSAEMMPVRSPSTPGGDTERLIPSLARRATFWNFARQDFLAACTSISASLCRG